MPDQPSLQKGLEYLKSNRIDEAIDIFEDATKHSPEDFRLFTYLGIAYAKKGKHNLAIGALQSASHLRPDVASIRYNLGLAFQADGLLEQAADQFEQALQIDPTYTHAEEALNLLRNKMNNDEMYSGRSCARHPEEPAVGVCAMCRLPICAECKNVVDDEIYCTTCRPKK